MRRSGRRGNWSMQVALGAAGAVLRMRILRPALLVGAVFAYVSKIDQRLTIVETQLIAQRDSSMVQRAQLERMDAKLDRLIERSK